MIQLLTLQGGPGGTFILTPVFEPAFRARETKLLLYLTTGGKNTFFLFSHGAAQFTVPLLRISFVIFFLDACYDRGTLQHFSFLILPLNSGPQDLSPKKTDLWSKINRCIHIPDEKVPWPRVYNENRAKKKSISDDFGLRSPQIPPYTNFK